jgi:hypothetical protein
VALAEGTARLTDPSTTLVLRAIGRPSELPHKVARLARAIAAYGGGAEIDRRLSRLHELGIVERIPSRVQLAVGAADMLRFWISPAAADYYEQRGLSYTFHQLLRFLDEPASLTDPIGLLSTRDGIIGHLMQVVHANPVYDLELLSMFDDGLDELEDQLGAMLAGTHPRAASIGAIVEEPDYHDRLLAFVRQWRVDPTAQPPLRSNVAASAELSELEGTFGSMRSAMRYFCRLPSTPLAGARHLLTVRRFPRELA